MLIGVLAIMSYITVTFMVEAMAIANALLPAAAAKDGPPKNIQGNDKQPLLGRGTLAPRYRARPAGSRLDSAPHSRSFPWRRR